MKNEDAKPVAVAKELPTCKLCHLQKPLIGKSHIIPDFLYKQSGLYDDKHRLRYFSVEDIINGGQPSLPQSGVHEGGILCADCDNRRLGTNLENYARIAIYGGGKLPANETPDCTNYIDPQGNTFGHCKNLDYTKYKLFLLSILWRASISSKPFFKGINIGEHEEVIRQMIMNNDPKNFYDYPILVSTSAADKQFSQDMIIEPRQLMGKHGLETCVFIIGGFIYVFMLGTYNGNRDELYHQTINENNEIVMHQTKDGETIEMIKNYVGLV